MDDPHKEATDKLTKVKCTKCSDGTGQAMCPACLAQTCAEQAGKIERLQAVVAKLPKTADGVRVVPGMTVYHRDWQGKVTEERTSWAPPYPKVFCCCYSTREAAEAAEAEGEEYSLPVQCEHGMEDADAKEVSDG